MISKASRSCVVGLVSLCLAACTTVHYGSPPHIDRLAKLQLGQSSSADVLLSLGEPRGHGVARLAPDMEAEQVWFYEYVVSDGKNVALKMLLVFVRQDVYDGYLWFSSAELIQKR